MPTNTLDPEEDDFGPGGRLSHSSRWAHSLCPRAWFFEREWGWRGLALPVLVYGHAVEETVCRTLKECPALVAENAISESFDSPTKSHRAYWGRRDRENTIIDQRTDASWKGPMLIPIEQEFSNIEDIRKWAYSRIENHWPRAIDSAHDIWSNDSNCSGDWDEFMSARGHLGPQLARSAIDLHLEEVAKCLEANGGFRLIDFRLGKRLEIPSPDGFSANQTKPHPCAIEEGDCTVLEAWELARPWFVDPDAGTFTQQAILPEGWFQGEYDLVYRWEGNVKIVDLKASDGTSEWAASYPVQMQTYAWLWWASHGKKESVSGLETWYLGSKSCKSYNLPTTSEMEEFENELHRFWEQHVATKGNRNIADYPALPAPVPRFDKGGGEKLGEGEPNVRCGNCLWAEECEGSGRRVPHNQDTEFVDHDGSHYNLKNVEEIVSRVSVEGMIGSWKPNQWVFGGLAPAFSISTNSNNIWCSSYKGGPTKIDDSIGYGSLVRVDNAYISPTRSGGVQLKLDEYTIITHIDENQKTGLEIPTSLQRVNVRGRVMSLAAAEGETNWGPWKRWGAELATANGPIEITAMNANIPFSHDEVNRGDEVVVIAGFSTSFGMKNQIAFDGETRLRIL